MNIFDVRREKGLGMANRAGVDECMSMIGVIMEDKVYSLRVTVTALA